MPAERHALVQTAVRPEVIRLPVSGGHQIQLLQLASAAAAGAQLLILPGSGQDSRSWLQGPAALPVRLAAAGFEVYLGDTRGKGGSLPKAGPQAAWGVHTAVTEELPQLLQRMRSHASGRPWFVLAESMAGLWLLASLARQPALFNADLKGILLLQSARPQPLSRYWQLVQGPGRWRAALDGYVRASWMLGGRAGESRRRFFESMDWCLAPDWTDPEDGFDYAAALQRLVLPAILHVAHANDRRLPLAAVRAFVHALPAHDARLLPAAADQLVAWRCGLADGGDETALGCAVHAWLQDCLAGRGPS